MQERLATADIMPLVKEAAMANLRNSRLDEILFLVGVLAAAFMALVLINKTLLGGSMKVARPTLPSFFIMVYVVLMALPAIVWFYAAPSDPIRYTYFLAMQSVLISFPIGMFLANGLFADVSAPLRMTGRFFSSPLRKSVDDRYALRIFLIMLVIAAAVATIYLRTAAYVPLIGALTEYGQVDGSVVRSSIFWEGDAIHYAHALTVRLLLPFCLVYSYLMAGVYRGRWRYLYWLTFAWAAFVSSLTFDRTYPFSVVLFLALVMYFRYQSRQGVLGAASAKRPRRRVMSKTRLAVYLAAMLVLAMFVGGLVSQVQYNRPLSFEIIRDTALGFFIDRVLLDASYMAYIYFEEFNTPDRFLYGQSLHVLISKAFGVEFYPTISPSFVAELWLNFGWPGVLMGSALVGFVLQLIQVKFFDRKTIPTLSFFVILLLNGAWIIYGHLLATMVLSVYVPSILILMLLKRRRKAAARAAERIAPHIQDLVPHGQ